jgi:hypothetical protein
MSETKKISIDQFNTKPSKKETKVIERKQPSKRRITTTAKWNFSEEDLSYDMQMSYIEQLKNDNIQNESQCNMIISLLKQKLNSYLSQDKKKNRLSIDEFVEIDEVIRLLYDCNNVCYYCKKPVEILYENVREPSQWSLERISNDIGHNKGNLVIACLHCNINRKTMNQERFVFTKQLNIVKTG